MGPLAIVPWWLWPVLFVALLAVYKRMGDDRTTGKVTGIVGRMGSGKSYFAVRLAYRRMMRGATVVTNFTMNLSPLHENECPPKCHARKRCRCRRGCPCRVADRWQMFKGWMAFAELENAVVILDEADLYAPSLDPRAIPDVARYKLKMARKYRLDLYWITQHESMVSRILRENLTHEIYVCSAWFGAKLFIAKVYENVNVRRKGKHLGRVWYLFRQRVADLYDTLETIEGDEMAALDTTMSKANELSRSYNAGRRVRCVHERAKRSKVGTCQECHDVGGGEVTPIATGQRVRERRRAEARVQAG